MSGRGYFLKMREWELDSMKAFVRELETHMDEVYALWFFYSFQIPRLGKEFDLLQIREDQIVNVELKSGAVSDEALRKQLYRTDIISRCRERRSGPIHISAARTGLSALRTTTGSWTRTGNSSARI